MREKELDGLKRFQVHVGRKRGFRHWYSCFATSTLSIHSCEYLFSAPALQTDRSPIPEPSNWQSQRRSRA